ncbi:hypothetical protein AOQ84DRAFT_439225 [Glonium stellatum]|uniref:Uncharacterized protein n=1 Tax=Glonium stellatum TaxID=574774 RepID=A0A8E2F321_9PEZI|nr:hypothetical protein AOQ84DRAFT_439225 [Glonium stellatum]
MDHTWIPDFDSHEKFTASENYKTFNNEELPHLKIEQVFGFEYGAQLVDLEVAFDNAKFRTTLHSKEMLQTNGLKHVLGHIEGFNFNIPSDPALAMAYREGFAACGFLLQHIHKGDVKRAYSSGKLRGMTSLQGWSGVVAVGTFGAILAAKSFMEGKY